MQLLLTGGWSEYFKQCLEIHCAVQFKFLVEMGCIFVVGPLTTPGVLGHGSKSLEYFVYP